MSSLWLHSFFGVRTHRPASTWVSILLIKVWRGLILFEDFQNSLKTEAFQKCSAQTEHASRNLPRDLVRNRRPWESTDLETPVAQELEWAWRGGLAKMRQCRCSGARAHGKYKSAGQTRSFEPCEILATARHKFDSKLPHVF